jgi:hypothetical protein
MQNNIGLNGNAENVELLEFHKNEKVIIQKTFAKIKM